MILKMYHLKILVAKAIITMLMACLGLSCNMDEVVTQTQENPDKVNLVIKTNEHSGIDDSFDIILQIDKITDEHYRLSATIELDSGTYIISPFSRDGFYSYFDMVISDNSALITQGDLSETPVSVEEYDDIIDLPVRLVRETTTYTQKLKVVSKDDFEVSGLVEFLLEPSCVPYDVEFTITSRSGKLDVQKTKTFISEEYKL